MLVRHARRRAELRSFGALAAAALFVHHQAQAQGEPSGSSLPSSAGAVRPADDAPPPDPKAAVEMPELLHFENAPYPPAAREAGIQADVLLRLTIDATGAVTEAEVMEPVGHGFDEAAQAAALKFRFSPARRGGKPVPVKIPFRYSFTLEQVPVEEPEPLRVGELSGKILVASGDAPLASAQVTVQGPGGSTTLTTDAAGVWRLSELEPGAYRVEVSAPGFETLALTEEVVAGQATEVTYRLAPRIEADTLEVLVEAERPVREVTRRTLDRQELTRIPGTRGDALRAIESLPGVARPPGLAGLIIVRGSNPESTETFIDGTNVPITIYHFGGITTIVPTELLDRFDFYPGNFSARYGRLTGGVVDIALRKPDTRCMEYGKRTDKGGCFHGMGQLDLIDARAMVEGPIAKDWSFIVAGRRSWIDTWIEPVLEEAETSVTRAPVYYDYQGIVDYTPNKRERLSLRVFGSDDRFDLVADEPSAQDPAFGGRVGFGTGFVRAQALYEADLTPELELQAMLAVGYTEIEFTIGNFLFDFDSYPIHQRSEFGWKIAPGVKLNFGQDLLAAPIRYQVRFPPPPRPGEPDPGPYSTRPPLESTVNMNAFRPGWYAEAELRPSPRWLIIPGVRLDHTRDSGQTDFSPRLVARYDLVQPASADEPGSENRRRTTLKAGIGVFYEPPQFQETDEVFGTPGLESNRAIHYALGVEQELTRQVELSLEGFYKDLDQLVARDAVSGGLFAYNNEGTGSVIGLETLLKYKPDERFFGWVAYTISRSVRKDDPDEEERLFQWDQTHNLSIVGSYALGRGWNVGGRFRLVSGALDTPVVGPPSLPALYSADSGSYAPLQGEVFGERLPTFHQLDIRIEKVWQFKDWQLGGYVELLNAYNNPAKEAITYNYNFTRRQYVEGLPILPNLGIRGAF